MQIAAQTVKISDMVTTTTVSNQDLFIVQPPEGETKAVTFETINNKANIDNMKKDAFVAVITPQQAFSAKLKNDSDDINKSLGIRYYYENSNMVIIELTGSGGAPVSGDVKHLLLYKRNQKTIEDGTIALLIGAIKNPIDDSIMHLNSIGVFKDGDVDFIFKNNIILNNTVAVNCDALIIILKSQI